MIKRVNSGMGESTPIRQCSFVVRMRKMSFPLFAGLVCMDVRSLFVVVGMILRDERSVKMEL
ncbi:hypothetical protein KDH_01760 [Dictyobacter sp. S3.2.2.5]|uniref:Transmembrane protein n=1 Tax=Dictyobacter halimunensis TaxID=3026934 RepID=A0ABQ6FLJ4_9CHLR|nr:hypothetical protein KDH_01760 [Dictyobacter sp. S3.2.2.5]